MTRIQSILWNSLAKQNVLHQYLYVIIKLLHIAMHCGVRHIHVYFTCLIGGEFWIGISDIIEEDRWIYSSDLQVTRVKDFHPGEPNQHTSANCVALWKRFRGYWADEPCETHYNFTVTRVRKPNYCYILTTIFIGIGSWT